MPEAAVISDRTGLARLPSVHEVCDELSRVDSSGRCARSIGYGFCDRSSDERVQDLFGDFGRIVPTGVTFLSLWVRRSLMSVEHESTERSEHRACQRCGLPLPAQNRGRPRRWCPAQCRQVAHEERHNLKSWKDNRPKVSDLSDVVEVVQNRAARRSTARQRSSTWHRSTIRWATVRVPYVQTSRRSRWSSIRSPTLISDQRLLNTTEGRFLAGGVARLVEVVHMVAFRVVPADVPPAPTRPQRANN